ncbi:MAG: hypothetical protein Q7T51_04845 [Candidatus Moranbacteria bacterium]|nr:hypothetical protein [Candidatus Moranbacteria bacterium]
MLKNKKILLSLIFLFSFTCVVYVSQAGTSETGAGWLWGGTTDNSGNPTGFGWVSMNSTTDGSSQNYGVNIPATGGQLSGQAWSENVGWIDFSGASISYDATTKIGTLAGTASIVGIKDENTKGNSGGWTGNVELANLNPDSFLCNLTGTSYADKASCDVACVQTATCNAPQVSGSASIALYSTAFDAVRTTQSSMSFYDNNVVRGTINLDVVGWVQQVNIGAQLRVVSFSGNSINFHSTTDLSRTLGSIDLIGSNISISGTNPIVNLKTVSGSGNTLVFSNASGENLTIAFSGDVCPLSNTLTCAGTPSTCVRPRTCTQSSVYHSVTVNPDGSADGYAWSGELGWIDFSKMSVAVPTACVSDGNFTYSCGVSSSCGACGATPTTNTWYCMKTDNCGTTSAAQADCITAGKTCSDVICPACSKRTLNWREVSPN